MATLPQCRGHGGAKPGMAGAGGCVREEPRAGGRGQAYKLGQAPGLGEQGQVRTEVRGCSAGGLASSQAGAVAARSRDIPSGPCLSCRRRARGSLTWMLMCPWMFSISPSMADTSEDFPEPTAPTTATRHPGATSRVTLQGKRSGGVGHWVGAQDPPAPARARPWPYRGPLTF